MTRSLQAAWRVRRLRRARPARGQRSATSGCRPIEVWRACRLETAAMPPPRPHRRRSRAERMVDRTTLISRVVCMDRAELAWRTATALRALGDRVRTRVVEPRWNRRDLLPVLTRGAALGAVRDALSRGD